MILINASDLMGANWRFIEPICSRPELVWSFHSGLPANGLERLVRRPALARYRAALSAVREAARTPGAVLVSHLPRMTAVMNILRRALCPQVPQIAFAFNFTDLPTGSERAFLRWALRDISEFVVFSTFEQALYADYFELPAERIRRLAWSMDTPIPAPASSSDRPVGSYLCAIGGEGRDYALLAEAARQTPEIEMIIIARPHNLSGIDVPPNVTVFTNLPAPQTWRILVNSAGLVIPLVSDRTACGHITIVGAQLLGVPIAVTGSRGVADYVSDETASLVPAGDLDGMSRAVRHLYEDREATGRRATRAQAFARSNSDLAVWVAYFETLELRQA